MADMEKHVTRGDPKRIPADTWNGLLDVLAWFRRHKGTIGANGYTDLIESNHEAFVRNDSGSDLTRSFRVLNLFAPLFALENNTFHNIARHSFKGDIPTSSEDFIGIVQEPMRDGKIGRAIFRGLTVARVRINSETDLWCKPIAGETEFLDSASEGIARVIYTWDDVSGSGSVEGSVDGSIKLALIDLVQACPTVGGDGSGSGSGSTVVSWLEREDVLTADISTARGRCGAIANQSVTLTYDTELEGWISLSPITTDTGDWTMYFYPPDIDHPVPWAFLLSEDESEYVDLEWITFANNKAVFAGSGDVLCAGEVDPDCAPNSFRVSVRCGSGTVTGTPVECFEVDSGLPVLMWFTFISYYSSVWLNDMNFFSDVGTGEEITIPIVYNPSGGYWVGELVFSEFPGWEAQTYWGKLRVKFGCDITSQPPTPIGGALDICPERFVTVPYVTWEHIVGENTDMFETTGQVVIRDVGPVNDTDPTNGIISTSPFLWKRNVAMQSCDTSNNSVVVSTSNTFGPGHMGIITEDTDSMIWMVSETPP